MEATLKTIDPPEPGQCARCKGEMLSAVWVIDGAIAHEDEFCSRSCTEIFIDNINEQTWARIQEKRAQ